MEFKYKVGDRVKILDGSRIRDYTASWARDMGKYVGKTTMVLARKLWKGRASYNLAGAGGYIFDERGLAPVPSDRIVIYTDKKDPSKVIAKDIFTGKTGVAKCSPEDTFDFYTGAKLAMERLLGVEEKVGQKIEIGDTVEFISEMVSVFYPEYGGKGVVKDIDLDGDLWVLWEGKDDAWCCGTEKVRLVSKKSTKTSAPKAKTSTPKSKFSVGQLVIGNEGANRYSITKEKTVWKVTGVMLNGSIEISGPKARRTGFEVNPDCFDLYTGTLPTFKVFCTESKYGWQKGKVYSIVNGKCIDDGRFDPCYCISAEQMSDVIGAGFIRVME